MIIISKILSIKYISWKSKSEKFNLVVGDGRQAVEALKGNGSGFDIVLMDVRMPRMDGLKATAAIRGLEKGTGRHVPIVAVTAYASKDNRRSCLAAGAQLHLVRPLGFSLEDRRVRRAGLDYWPRVVPRVWPDWESLGRAP